MNETFQPRRRALLGIAMAAAAAPAVSGCAGHHKAEQATDAAQHAQTTSAKQLGEPLSGTPGDGPQVLMMIRHAEKPTGSGAPYGLTPDGEHDDKSLTVQGWTRAGALIGLFAPRTGADAPAPVPAGLTRPTSVYAANPTGASKRPYQTVTPLAAALGGIPDSKFAKGKEAELAKALLALSGSVLVAWEHQSIPAIVAHLGPVTPAPPTKWPDARFDVVWVFTRAASGGWTFTQVPQVLLADDLPTPIA